MIYGMPCGKGSYGSQKGRPSKKSKIAYKKKSKNNPKPKKKN